MNHSSTLWRRLAAMTIGAACLYAPAMAPAWADSGHDHAHMAGMPGMPAAEGHTDGHAGPHGAAAHSHGENPAIGRPGDAAHVNRTVTLDMRDTMRFTPQVITVKRGDTVRFQVKNAGRIQHEMVLGSAADLQAHANAMRANPGAMQHAEDNAVSLAPDHAGQLIWQFTRAGTVEFACLEPGHFEAGMKGRIVVR